MGGGIFLESKILWEVKPNERLIVPSLAHIIYHAK